ncbi:hypothetical protein Tco_1023843 [Tanacetum coccineum]
MSVRAPSCPDPVAPRGAYKYVLSENEIDMIVEIRRQPIHTTKTVSFGFNLYKRLNSMHQTVKIVLELVAKTCFEVSYVSPTSLLVFPLGENDASHQCALICFEFNLCGDVICFSGQDYVFMMLCEYFAIDCLDRMDGYAYLVVMLELFAYIHCHIALLSTVEVLSQLLGLRCVESKVCDWYWKRKDVTQGDWVEMNVVLKYVKFLTEYAVNLSITILWEVSWIFGIVGIVMVEIFIVLAGLLPNHVEGETGGRVGRGGGRGGGPRIGNDERVDELNGQGNDQGLGANRGVEGVNGNAEGANGECTRLLNDHCPAIAEPLTRHASSGCSYKDFLACNPKEYDGKGGAVVCTRWIEKMKFVDDMSGCSTDQKVKYTVGSFVGKALTWWNSHIYTRSREIVVELFSDYDCEICYHPGKANVVADALSRKERVKPKRVRAMNMILQSGIKDKILAAQKEAVDEFAGLQRGLDEMIEQRSDGTLYYLDRIWVPLKSDIKKFNPT